MTNLKQQWLVAPALAMAMAASFGSQPAAAQVMGDSACPHYAVDHAAFATCDGDRVAPSEAEIPRIGARQAYERKVISGKDVLLLDVRSKLEAALIGVPMAVDAVVPVAEIAEPLRWDPTRDDLQLVTDPNFSAMVQAWVAVLGGDRHTPLLLICRSGERSMRAAQMLRAAGHEHVAVVTGGFEGEIGTDGKRHGGWKDAGLPWVARADEALIFGPSD